MKKISKPQIKAQPTQNIVAASYDSVSEIRLTMVSEAEREMYQVPSYGYLLP